MIGKKNIIVKAYLYPKTEPASFINFIKRKNETTLIKRRFPAEFNPGMFGSGQKKSTKKVAMAGPGMNQPLPKKFPPKLKFAIMLPREL